MTQVRQTTSDWIWVAVLIVIVVAVQLAIGLAVISYLPDWQTRGTFGDMFGVVGTLFSGLAFAFLIYAVLLQRRELALQREELEETRKELHRSATAQEESRKILEKQLALATGTDLATTAPLLVGKGGRHTQEQSGGTTRRRSTCNFVNAGGTVFHPQIKPVADEPDFSISLSVEGLLMRDTSETIIIEHEVGRTAPCQFALFFTDSKHRYRCQIYNYYPAETRISRATSEEEDEIFMEWTVADYEASQKATRKTEPE